MVKHTAADRFKPSKGLEIRAVRSKVGRRVEIRLRNEGQYR